MTLLSHSVYVGPRSKRESAVTAEQTDSQRTWTIAEAKARLSEILRLAEEEGPQRIGKRTTFIVVAKRERDQRSKPLGQWLLENVPRGIELELPDRKDEPEGEIPFQTGDWD